MASKPKPNSKTITQTLNQLQYNTPTDYIKPKPQLNTPKNRTYRNTNKLKTQTRKLTNKKRKITKFWSYTNPKFIISETQKAEKHRIPGTPKLKTQKPPESTKPPKFKTPKIQDILENPQNHQKFKKSKKIQENSQN